MPFPLRGAPSGQPWETASGTQSELPSAPATPPRGAVQCASRRGLGPALGVGRTGVGSAVGSSVGNSVGYAVGNDVGCDKKESPAYMYVCMYPRSLSSLSISMCVCVCVCVCVRVHVCMYIRHIVSTVARPTVPGPATATQRRDRPSPARPGPAQPLCTCGNGRAQAPSAGEPSPGTYVAADHARRAE
jgi:hypothetical protein